MSDKIQKIKQEIERRMNNLWYLIPEGEKVLKDDFTKDDANNLGKYTALESLLQFIDSIQEPASEDLEEEIDRYYSDWQFDDDTIYEDMRDICRHFAEWQKQQMKETLQTEYEKGRFDMREEMMKDTVEAFVNTYENTDDSNYVEFVTEQSPYKFKETEKCKLIIFKEDK